MNEINRILNPQEKILWEGQPIFWPFFLSRAIRTGILGLALILLPVLVTQFILLSVPTSASLDINNALFWPLAPLFILGLFFCVIPPLYYFLVYFFLHYAITDQRIIIQSGVIGRDFYVLTFPKITNADVVVGFFDKFLGTGSVLISTAGAPARRYAFSNIAAPYDVFKFFQSVTLAKTNKLGPSE